MGYILVVVNLLNVVQIIFVSYLLSNCMLLGLEWKDFYKGENNDTVYFIDLTLENSCLI